MVVYRKETGRAMEARNSSWKHHDSPPLKDGTSMEAPRKHHGGTQETWKSPRQYHEHTTKAPVMNPASTMEAPWKPHGSIMKSPRKLHRSTTEEPRRHLKPTMVPPWFLRGACVVGLRPFPWCFRGAFMVDLWSLRGASAVLP